MNTQNPNFNAYDEAVESINLNETPEQVEARADACDVVQSITNDNRSEAQDALDVIIEGSPTEMEKIKTLDFSRVRAFLKQAAMVGGVVLAPMLISSCEKNVVNPGGEVVAPVVDKTWAKEIEGGKEFLVNIGVSGYSVDGLTLKAEPSNYASKSVKLIPSISRDKVLNLLDRISAENLGKPSGIAVTIMYKNPGEDSFKRFGSVILSNRSNFKLSRPYVDISLFAPNFTLKGLPDSNGGTIAESGDFNKDVLFEIRGIVFYGEDPNLKQLGEYNNRFSFGI